jgi:hypothetical protein
LDKFAVIICAFYATAQFVSKTDGLENLVALYTKVQWDMKLLIVHIFKSCSELNVPSKVREDIQTYITSSHQSFQLCLIWFVRGGHKIKTDLLRKWQQN